MLWSSSWVHLKNCSMASLLSVWKTMLVLLLFALYLRTLQLIWDRALGLPIERPKSVTLKWIEETAAAKMKQ